MNFAEALDQMWNHRKIICCESIDKMSRECEPNFGQEIIGYFKGKTIGVCRITVDTCGKTWGKLRLNRYMSFDNEDMADDTWYVVENFRERRSEILRRHLKEQCREVSVEDIRKERQERYRDLMEQQLFNRTALLHEAHAVCFHVIEAVMDSIDNEAIKIYALDDIIFSDADIESPALSKARLQVFTEIQESKTFREVLDLGEKIEEELGFREEKEDE